MQSFLVIDGAKEGLEQAGEGLGLGPVARLAGLRIVDVRQAIGGRVAVLFFVGLEEVVSAVALVGVEGLDERVSEDLDVAGGNPHLARLDDRGIDTHDVRAGLDHVAPPLALDVFLELDTQRAVVPCGAGTAVNLAGLIDQAAALAQANNGVDDGCHDSFYTPTDRIRGWGESSDACNSLLS